MEFQHQLFELGSSVVFYFLSSLHDKLKHVHIDSTIIIIPIIIQDKYGQQKKQNSQVCDENFSKHKKQVGGN